LASPGQPVPVIAVVGYGDGLLGEGTRLRGRFETTTLSTEIEVPAVQPAFAGLRFSSTVLSVGCAPYRYEDGERFKPLEISGSCAGGGLVAGVNVAEGLALRAFVGGRRIWYSRRDTTGAGLVKPADHTAMVFRIEGNADRMRYFQDWEIAQGWDASFLAEYFRRDVWRPWGLPGDPQTRAGAHREGASLSGTGRVSFRHLRHHDFRLACHFGVAWDVDVLSGFRTGSLVGTPRMPGYYYGEVACDRYGLFEGRYALNLWKLKKKSWGCRGWAGATFGGFRDLDGPVRGTVCFTVGLTQRLFLGMPLSIAYGYSPTAERDTGGGGHEVYVLVAGAIS
jgi:hypothetical protein